MKTFYLKFLGVFLSLLGFGSYAALVSGCATLTQHSAVVELVVSQATMRYVESKPVAERAATAQHIVSITTDIEAVANGKPVTIAELAQLAISAIPSNLAPSDRSLALSIVQVAAQELQAKVGENILSAEQTVTVKEVVNAIRAAASIYAGGS